MDHRLLLVAALLVTSCKPKSEASTDAGLDPKQAVVNAPTIASALAGSKSITQRNDEEAVNEGTIVFAAWAARSMTWSDVETVKNETTLALFQKDADEARGKRVCARGTIQLIEAKTSYGAKSFRGTLIAPDGGYSFFAVKSSGQLVKGSTARLCGVVVDGTNYIDAQGAAKPSLVLVGLFDLPENKSARGEQ